VRLRVTGSLAGIVILGMRAASPLDDFAHVRGAKIKGVALSHKISKKFFIVKT
jgi:hypothetical protein